MQVLKVLGSILLLSTDYCASVPQGCSNVRADGHSNCDHALKALPTRRPVFALAVWSTLLFWSTTFYDNQFSIIWEVFKMIVRSWAVLHDQYQNLYLELGVVPSFTCRTTQNYRIYCAWSQKAGCMSTNEVFTVLGFFPNIPVLWECSSYRACDCVTYTIILAEKKTRKKH